MIRDCLAHSGLGEFFGQRVSADEVGVFKPSPLVYRHAAERLARPAGRIRLVTSNAFDSVARARPACARPGSTGPPPRSTRSALSLI